MLKVGCGETASSRDDRRQRKRARSCFPDLASALIVREPEKLVFPERASHGVAELVTPQFRLSRVEETSRVEFVVAQEFERRSVKAVGAGLSNRVHHRAAEFSILRIKAIGDQPVFVYLFQIVAKSNPKAASFAHVAAAHQTRVGGIQLPLYRPAARIRR